MPANDCVPYFASDYRGDPGVESLDFAGRGLWHEMYVMMMTTQGIFMYRGKPIREKDLDIIAKATRGDVKDVRRIFPQVKDSGVYSVTDDGTIYCRKLVEYFTKKARKSSAGKEGGKKSAQARAQANAQAELLKRMLERDRQALSIPLHTNNDLATLDHGAGAQEKPPGGPLEQSAAYRFVRFMFDAGIEHGALSGYEALDPFKWCYPQTDHADLLLGMYGEDEGRVRAVRFAKAKGAHRIRRQYTVESLLKLWDFEEIRGEVRVAGGAQKSSGLRVVTKAELEAMP